MKLVGVQNKQLAAKEKSDELAVLSEELDSKLLELKNL